MISTLTAIDSRPKIFDFDSRLSTLPPLYTRIRVPARTRIFNKGQPDRPNTYLPGWLVGLCRRLDTVCIPCTKSCTQKVQIAVFPFVPFGCYNQGNNKGNRNAAQVVEIGENNMTVKELKRFYDGVEHCKIGYCCYQDAGVSKYDLIELGYNRGVYGWNWTAGMNLKKA